MPLQPPVVPDFRAGVYEHGVDLNTSLRDALGFLTARCVFKARQTTTQSIASGTWTAITFQAIDEDPYGGWSNTHPERYVAQISGTYLASGLVAHGGTTVANTTGLAGIGFDQALASGGLITPSTEQTASLDGNAWGIPAAWTTYLGVGDYITIAGYQSSGGALSTNVGTGLQSALDVYWISA